MIDGHTDTHTHTQATTIPEDQNWPRVKNYKQEYIWLWHRVIQVHIHQIESIKPIMPRECGTCRHM